MAGKNLIRNKVNYSMGANYFNIYANAKFFYFLL